MLRGVIYTISIDVCWQFIIETDKTELKPVENPIQTYTTG